MSQMNDPRIGDFSKPLMQKTEAPTMEKRMASQEAALEKEASEVQTALDPLEAYEKNLKDHDINRDDAAKIVDDVLSRGYYSEAVKITNSVSARFRSRQYRDLERLRMALETLRPQYPANYQEIVLKYTLASSIEQYKDQKFSHPTKTAKVEEVNAAFDKRLEFVSELPEVMFDMLNKKLLKFDSKIRVVFEEGAVENF